MDKQQILSATGKELRENFRSYDALIKAIIRSEKEWLKNNTIETRTLTGLWYDFAKIVLGRFAGAEAHKPKWARYRRQRISNVLSEMVLSGELDYEDLSIENTDRKIQMAYSGLWDKYILFCEKDEAYDHLSSVAELYQVHACSGKGQNATAAMTKLFNSLDKNKKYLVYLFTDYDRYGFTIASSFEERAQRLGYNCDFVRIGINPDQLEKDVIEAKKYPIPLKNPGDLAWAKEYGIDEKYGLELEALVCNGSYDMLRQVVAKVFQEELDVQKLYDQERSASLYAVKEREVERIIESVVGKLREDLNLCASNLTRQEGYDDRKDLLPDHAFKRAVAGDRVLHMNWTSLSDKLSSDLKEAIQNGEIELELDLEGFE